jgi:8-oxo-dGTP pyrophosphatase MutT (NUDIX family)
MNNRIAFSTHGFAVVVCRNFQGKYLAVKESRGRGWWLPAGHVDAGQNFVDAAIRETIEEAGVEINIRGVLAVEHTLSSMNEARMRVIFYAEPKNPHAIPKSIPDKESDGAEWKTLSEIEGLSRFSPPQGLRGGELLHWGKYIEGGGLVAPIEVGRNRHGQPTYEGFFRMENEGPTRVFPPITISGLSTAAVDPNAICHPDKRWTLLHAAVNEDNLAETRRLLLLGANASAVTHKQRSPLHFASSRGNIEILRLLLLSGTATLAQPDYQGQTALDMAHLLPSEHPQKERIISLLVQATAL